MNVMSLFLDRNYRINRNNSKRKMTIGLYPVNLVNPVCIASFLDRIHRIYRIDSRKLLLISNPVNLVNPVQRNCSFAFDFVHPVTGI
jgi:hypothetical protein